MDALPSELVDLVVESIDADEDMHDLKSCCLAASIFRYPCQKRVHRSMMLLFDSGLLDDDEILVASPRYLWRSVLGYLENHPHLVQHVVALRLFLPSSYRQPPEESPHSLFAMSSVLGKLYNVRELEIVGRGLGCSSYAWSRLPLQFTDALFEWLHACDGTLDQICCKFLHKLPPAAFEHMLAASSSLQFLRCRDDSDSDSEAREVSSQLSPATRPLRRLLFDQSESVIRFFLPADTQNYVLKGLKKLGLSSFSLPSPSSQLCCAVADSLEDLTLHLDGRSVCV
uniref:F-box domain-containing protein n=1 Tax=Mycena chlorophos TaxID=658473 RepID=A0ABQ0LW56_MYCCL|nr:predicted protein [Mycena chlorophos]